MAKRPVSVAMRTIVVEETVRAPRARVWRSLVGELGRWWPAGFLSLPGSRRMVMEARLGGRMYEDAGRGQGLLWYTVAGIHAGRSLTLSGDISAEFGGPARSLVTVSLEDAGKGTRVVLRDALVGRVDAKNARLIEGGWKFILGKGLKPHAERARRKA